MSYVFLQNCKNPLTPRLRYPNPLDELETLTVEHFSASLITFLSTILDSNRELLSLRPANSLSYSLVVKLVIH